MRLCEVLGDGRSPYAEQLFLIKNSCSQFLNESRGFPVFKQLQSTQGPIARIKVRHKAKLVNQFFGESVLRSSSGGKSIVESKSTPYPDNQNFWIFPTNGYSYLYSPSVQDYSANIKNVLGQTSDEDIIREMVQDAYLNTNLSEGIASGAQILWYGISSYYAVDCSSFMDYNELLNLL